MNKTNNTAKPKCCHDRPKKYFTDREKGSRQKLC